MTAPAAGLASRVLAPRDPHLRDDEFGRLAGIIKDETGIALAENKRPMLQARLSGRLRVLGLGSFAAYCDLLARREPTELAELISAVTTNVTSFFRERHHFDHLAQTALPPLIDRARRGGRVRLWSSACATGEEAWSIAALVVQLCPDAPQRDIRILATDVDRKVLARAESGAYPPQTIDALPPADRQGLIRDGRIDPTLRALVRFRPLNLIGDWPMTGGFDIVFCRNVVIYFDRPTQEQLWQRFARILPPGGWLYLGHSERIAGPAASAFRPAALTTYAKI